MLRTKRFLDIFVTKFRSALIVSIASFLLLPTVAFAYVGPGAGLTAIGTVLALIAAVLLGIFGFIWYPVKRLLRGRKSAEENEAIDAEEEPAGVSERLDSAKDDR